jgi:hypothetical protein
LPRIPGHSIWRTDHDCSDGEKDTDCGEDEDRCKDEEHSKNEDGGEDQGATEFHCRSCGRDEAKAHRPGRKEIGTRRLDLLGPLPDAIEVRRATANKTMRITWPDGSGVHVNFYSKGGDKAVVAIEHQKLPDESAVHTVKQLWGATLDRLKAMLEGKDGSRAS